MVAKNWGRRCLSLILLLVWAGPVFGEKYYEVESYSNNLTIDQIYLSMRGPKDEGPVDLLDSKTPELLWLTTAKAEVFDIEDNKSLSSEHLCHANLFVRGKGWYFTVDQGKQEIKLPDGFGVPLLSTDNIRKRVQILNLSEVEEPFDVKVKFTLGFVRDAELTREYKPLARLYLDMLMPEVHFAVPPGRHTFRYTIPKKELRYNTTIHYMVAHLHAYGESLELIDKTTGESLFKSYVTLFDNRPGIQKSEHYSSEQGIPIFKDHTYELVAVYNNTTHESIDGMGIMYTYVLDPHHQIRSW